MDKVVAEPRVEDGAVLFNVLAGHIERECVVSKNALTFLSQLQEQAGGAMNVYMAYEEQIHKVAKRLVLAGENATPLILGAGYFIDLLVSRRP